MEEGSKFKEEKKQKAGLNAVRPDSYTESTFKNLAKEHNLSQTKFFEHIFYRYLRQNREEEKEQVLSFAEEINLISYSMDSILQQFKKMAEKSQGTVMSLVKNNEQNTKNFTLEIETRDKRIEEIEKRNIELQQANSAFEEIKANLNDEIIHSHENLNKQIAIVEDLSKQLAEKDKLITSCNQTIADQSEKLSTQKDVLDLTKQQLKEITSTLEEQQSINKQFKNMVAHLEMNLKSFESLKQSEIQSVKGEYLHKIDSLNAKIEEMKAEHIKDQAKLKDKIVEIETQHVKEQEKLKSQLEREYEVDRKVVFAEMTLEISNLKLEIANLIAAQPLPVLQKENG